MSAKQRLNHCYAPGCSTGYARTNSAKKLSLFKAPADPERRCTWERNLHRADKPLTTDCAVCELHFEQRFIVRDYVHRINGEEVRIPRGTPTLTPDAVPTILPNLPAYLSKQPTPKRNERKRKGDDEVPPRKKARGQLAETTEDDEPTGATVDNEVCVAATVAAVMKIKVPGKRWTLHELHDADGVCFTSCSLDSLSGEVNVEKAVFFTANSASAMNSKTFVLGKQVAGASVATIQDAITTLLEAHDMHLCKGAASRNESCLTTSLTMRLQGQIRREARAAYSTNCLGKTTKEGTACVVCKYLRKALVRRQWRLERRQGQNQSCNNASSRWHGSVLKKLQACTRKNKRLLSKVDKLALDLKKIKSECAATAEDVLVEKLSFLSPKQQLAVRQCFEASRRKSPRGMKYDKEWILECILLKMRSPKLYQYMRRQNILVLPSETTLRKYTAQYRSGYGFNEKMLSVLEKKAAHLDVFHRHGGIVVDEMKLAEHLSVTTGAKIEGFVDLGPYTPEKEKTLPCNHGLVVMFVPMVGSWTQVIGVFGSNENVKGDLLAKIVLESTILAERAGLFVDFVTCDAAAWNRKMWRIFNIRASLKEVVCKKPHPVESSRFLHFLSDFPHLVKNVRNRLLTTTFDTPDGAVSMQFPREALKLDSNAVTMKAMPGITSVHVFPNNFEKMRASYAFQLFGHGPLRAFFLYRTQLERSCGKIEATEKFFMRMKSLIAVMTARYTAEALRLHSAGEETIKEMLCFLDVWERHADKKKFLSESTAEGLRVTLTSTLELLRYLHHQVGFSYLLTSRLSQDKVENFFGIVRLSSGCNSHPTPQQFLLTVNCLSFYNLAHSVAGGNAEGDVISSLLDVGDREETSKQQLIDQMKLCTEKQAVPSSSHGSEAVEHEYNVQRSDSRLIYYISGYVAKKCVLPTKCCACNDSLLLPTEEGRRLHAAEFVRHNDEGGLLYPSVELFRFITRLEDIFTNCFSAQKVHRESVMDILHMIHCAAPLKVGCRDHAESLTPRIVSFYVTTRLHFFIKGLNKAHMLSKRKAAQHLKLSRLT